MLTRAGRYLLGNFCYVSPDSSREGSCSRLVFHLGFGYLIFFLIGKQQIWVTYRHVIFFFLQPLSYRFNRGKLIRSLLIGNQKKKMIFEHLGTNYKVNGMLHIPIRVTVSKMLVNVFSLLARSFWLCSLQLSQGPDVIHLTCKALVSLLS